MKANANRAKRASAHGTDVLAGGYRMDKSGPEVNPAELELEHVASLEVSVSWGDNVLHVEHLTPPRAFSLGETEGTDFTVEAAALGASRMPLVVIENGMPAIVLPYGATGQIETVGSLPDRIADLVAAGRTAPYFDPKGIVQNAHVLVLQAGSQATVRYPGSDLSFRVASVCAGRPVPVDIFTPASGDAVKFVAASFIAHASMLGAMAFFMPGLGGTDAESVDRTNVLLMQKLLTASAERETEAEQAAASASGGDGDQAAEARKGEEGSRAAGVEGKVGSTTSTNASGRVAVQKNHDGNVELSRAAQIDEARHSDMAQLVSSLAPTSALSQFTRENGIDTLSANGNAFIGDIGEASGNGGLRLDGIGGGGGGLGDGLALDGVHGVGLGGEPWGTCTGPNCGGGKGGGPGGPGGNGGSCVGDNCGIGHGPTGRSMRPHIPRIAPLRPPTIDIGGRLDREVIQRIVRQNFGRFRACYEDGLRTNPSLTGRVEVKFMIDRDGSVMTSSDGGSDLPDAAVVKCVVKNFAPLSFPQPVGGTVGVTYPLVFSPSE